MEKKTWRTLVRTLAAACFLAGSAAQAAYYSSRWDPEPLVVNAVVEVNNCGNTGFVWVNQGGCTASLYSVIATLNKVDRVKLDPPAYIDFIAPTGFYGSGSSAVTDDNADDVILGLQFGSTGLVGILWNPLAFLGPREEEDGTPVLVGEGPWKLSFLNTPARGDRWGSTALLWDLSDCTPDGHHRTRRSGHDDGGHCVELEDTAKLLFEEGTTDVHYVALGNTPPTTYARDGRVLLDVAAVPEPGSLALLAGALGAGWITRRRRRNA